MYALDPGIFDGGTAWLEVRIYHAADAVWEILLPRQPVTSTAYALKAGDADTLAGNTPGAFAPFVHEHDAAYINEGQANSVTASMIADNTIGASDLGTDSVGSSEIAANAVASAEVANESLTAADLGPDSVGTSEVINNSITSLDLASGSVTNSEIAWSINHTGTDLNGGILSLTNSSNATAGNFPMGVSGAVTGSPGTTSPVIGVFGGAPGLGQGAPMTSFPGTKIGVGGASDTGFGVAGVSTSGYGVYGHSTSDDAGYFVSEYGSGRGVYGLATNDGNYTNYGGFFSAAGTYGRGVYGLASGEYAYGVYGYSSNGDGIYGSTNASDEHAGYFNTNVGSGLAGAALYTRTYNSTGNGIALWAHNDYSTSTDAAAVFSNDGTGPLIKGFGGNGGEDEFRINNDGTMYFFNSSHETTVVIDPEEGSGGVGGQITLYNGTGTATISIDGDYGGDGRITTQELQITGGSDLSEQFDIKPTEFEIAPGMVVSIDPDAPGHLKVSRSAYDKKVAGIVSGANGIKTGMMMGQAGTEADGQHPVALTGRVYCWADTSTGSIQPGDLLTTSNIPGHAMKVNDHNKAVGTILGKAMTPLETGRGLVLVLVSLQ